MSQVNNSTNSKHPLIPLDGKTVLESPKLQQLTTDLHHEIKGAIEKNYQAQWNKQQQEIFRTIAILLKPNYPKSADLDDEAYLFSIIEKIQDYLSKTPSKKGRPKKKKNPWQHILYNDTETDSNSSVECSTDIV